MSLRLTQYQDWFKLIENHWRELSPMECRLCRNLTEVLNCIRTPLESIPDICHFFYTSRIFGEQGNYSLRRPPKLTIPEAVIGQRWATVYRFMCKQICISNKANMTRALMRVQFWVNGQYSPRTEPTEWPIFIHWGCWTPITAFKPW